MSGIFVQPKNMDSNAEATPTTESKPDATNPAESTSNDKATSHPIVNGQILNSPELLVQAGYRESYKKNQPTLETSEPTEGGTPSEETKVEDPVTEPTTEVKADPPKEEASGESEAQATSEEPKEEPTKEEASDDGYFFIGETTQYKTAEEAKKGIDVKDRHIKNLDNQIEQLQSTVQTLETTNALYAANLSEEDLINSLVDKKLPQEYQGKKEEDFDDPADLRKFIIEKERVNVQVRESIREGKKQREAADKARKQKTEEAKKFVGETATLKFFGVKTPDQRDTVVKGLSAEDDQGYTLRNKAVLITEVFGEKAGEIFLKGVREELGLVQPEPQAPKEEPKKSTAESQTKTVPDPEVVEKVKRAEVKASVTTKAPDDLKAEIANMSPIERIQYSFKKPR